MSIPCLRKDIGSYRVNKNCALSSGAQVPYLSYPRYTSDCNRSYFTGISPQYDSSIWFYLSRLMILRIVRGTSRNSRMRLHGNRSEQLRVLYGKRYTECLRIPYTGHALVATILAHAFINRSRVLAGSGTLPIHYREERGKGGGEGEAGPVAASSSVCRRIVACALPATRYANFPVEACRIHSS